MKHENNYQKWHFFGDVNYLLHGGMFVRRAYGEEDVREYPIFEDEFEVVMINGCEDICMEDVVRMAIKRVCLRDYAEKRTEIIDIIAGREPYSNHEYAQWIAEYVGIEVSLDEAYSRFMYPEYQDYFISVADAKEWLKKLGIERSAA